MRRTVSWRTVQGLLPVGTAKQFGIVFSCNPLCNHMAPATRAIVKVIALPEKSGASQPTLAHWSGYVSGWRLDPASAEAGSIKTSNRAVQLGYSCYKIY